MKKDDKRKYIWVKKFKKERSIAYKLREKGYSYRKIAEIMGKKLNRNVTSSQAHLWATYPHMSMDIKDKKSILKK